MRQMTRRRRDLIAGSSPFDPVFSKNTWQQIIAACQANLVPSTWKVMDSKMMTINGVDYQVDIIGKNHDVYANSTSTAPLTLQLSQLYQYTYGMRNNTFATGWGDCQMRSTVLPQILSLLPVDVGNAIQSVQKKAMMSYGNTAIGTYNDKLFLLSKSEISTDDNPPQEGEQYEMYQMLSGVPGSWRKTLVNTPGQYINWWTRTYDQYTTQYYYAVSTSDSYTFVEDSASKDFGVSFAFCF